MKTDEHGRSYLNINSSKRELFDALKEQVERAEAAEAALQAVMTRVAQLEVDNNDIQGYINEIRVSLHTEKDELTIDAVRRIISERDELRNERDDYKVRMQSWHDSAMTLADQRDAAYRRNIDLETERDELARQIAAAVAEEREACAELAKSMIGATRHEIADAIRARK